MRTKRCRNTVDPTRSVRTASLPTVACSLAVLLPVVVCQAATFHVPADFEKIQDAIDAATHEDAIIVATGTYEENLALNGKDITLRSLDPEDKRIVKATIIKNTRSPSTTSLKSTVIVLSGTETASCVISGFSVMGGQNLAVGGAGGIVGNGSLATICRNRVEGNEGGILSGCNGRICENVFSNNGGTLRYCDGLVDNNLFYLNGAALDSCNGTIVNNTIVNGTGGGILHCFGEIRNCIIWGNGRIPAKNYIDSTTPSYCCIAGWVGGGEGNIFTDPRFVDPENGDFHLLPDSFCIDSGGATGLVTEDIEGVPRPFDAAPDTRGDGSDIDIGAYEFVGTVRSNQLPLQPTNLSPPEGATDQITLPELSASAFADPDAGDFHAGSQWQVDDELTFADPEYDSGPTPLEITAARVAPHHLSLSTDYWWRVRYLDHLHGWSEWSVPTGFSTRAAEGIVVPQDYPTIQAAVDAATDGETVTVLPGTYYENIWMNGKNITLQSLEPTDEAVVAYTVINASRSGPAVLYLGTETKDSVLAGFTLTNALGDPCVFGNKAYPRITKNWIQDNESGGLHRCNGLIARNIIRNNNRHGLAYCNARIENNLICGNEDQYGAGLYRCYGRISNNVICDNTALIFNPFPSGQGGGLFECGNMIEGNLIFGNVSWEPGAALAFCYGDVLNNTIVENGYQSALHSCNGEIENNIIASSYDEPLSDCSDPTYCLLSPWEGGGTGNVTGDPMFVDETNEDFHLLSGSPCIDAGKRPSHGSGTDFEGNSRGYDAISVPRGDGSNIDIGAYEYCGPYVLAPDLNDSWSVDFLDLFLFQDEWHAQTAALSPGNVVDDGAVDALDLLILLTDWQRETGP